MKLKRKYIEKPWGRMSLPPQFDPPQGKRIGEIWYTAESDVPLLAKYIFTSEPLSIQVHPNGAQAHARGLAGGKAECWYILEAEPDAVLGLGLVERVSAKDLRRSALDGSIEKLMRWHRVRAGDFIFVPPGTIHAIGAGISLLEFQQNADVTYRLYDYGRGRELHLEDGVEVASAAPFDVSSIRHLQHGQEFRFDGHGLFKLAAGSSDVFKDSQRWVMPLSGIVHEGEDIAEPGDVVLAEPGATMVYDDAWVLTGAADEPASQGQ